MAVLIISAKPSFLPDADEPAGWTLQDEEAGMWIRNVGGHRLFLTGCIADVGKKQKIKHETVAGFVRLALSQAPGEGPVYLIVHDKDLLKASSGDEGIYPEEWVEQIGSSLAGLIPDRHIYVFQHVARQDMFEALIGRLLDELEPSDVDAVTALIDGCDYETPLS